MIRPRAVPDSCGASETREDTSMPGDRLSSPIASSIAYHGVHPSATSSMQMRASTRENGPWCAAGSAGDWSDSDAERVVDGPDSDAERVVDGSDRCLRTVATCGAVCA